jgi:hypothetical protein
VISFLVLLKARSYSQERREDACWLPELGCLATYVGYVPCVSICLYCGVPYHHSMKRTLKSNGVKTNQGWCGLWFAEVTQRLRKKFYEVVIQFYYESLFSTRTRILLDARLLFVPVRACSCPNHLSPHIHSMGKSIFKIVSCVCACLLWSRIL